MSATHLREMIDGAREVEIEPPRPLQRPLEPADPFPMEALGSILGGAALGIVDPVQCPEAVAGQSVLAVATLAVQGHADVELPQGSTAPLSSFFLTVAFSGERKSAADRKALWPIRQREKALRAQYDDDAPDCANRRASWDALRQQILSNRKLRHARPGEAAAPVPAARFLNGKDAATHTPPLAARCAVQPAADRPPAAGADQGQAHLMTVFQGAVDATFATFGIDAVYTPAGGDPVSVRVLARRPDTIVGFGDTRIHDATTTFEVRASEVADPRHGDQLALGSETFVVQEPERRDPDRLVWTLDTR